VFVEKLREPLVNTIGGDHQHIPEIRELPRVLMMMMMMMMMMGS
jgi:hypothetical protein